MGLTAPNQKFIISLKKKYGLKGPVLTLGNQDVYATEKDINLWFKENKLKAVKPKNIYYSTGDTVKKINNESKRFIHAKTFFEFLGIPEKEYFDIDKFDFDKPKILQDLEKPISKKYHNFFRLIIDGGTLEHIFDIKSLMTNLVKATKISGYIIHFVPANNFLNHGFYQPSPTFFYDFYEANGFEIVEAYLVELRAGFHRYYYYDHKKDYLGVYINPTNRLANCFVVRKKRNINKIISPSQSIYVKLNKNAKNVEKEWNKGIFNGMVTLLRKLVPFKYQGLFYQYWYYLKTVLSKKKYFDIEL
jgi:hypothetical protein